MYSCYLFLISSASVRSIQFLSFIVPIFAWNVPLVSLRFLKTSLAFPILLFSSISLQWSLGKSFLCLLALHLPWNRYIFLLCFDLDLGRAKKWGWWQILPLLKCGSLSIFSQDSKLLFSCLVVSVSLCPHGLQHAGLPWPSLSPGVCSSSCPLSRWCHPTFSSSVIPFSCPQFFPPSGSFPMSRFFASCGQSTGTSASTSVLRMNIHSGLISFRDWLTGLLSLLSKGLSKVFFSTTVPNRVTSFNICEDSFFFALV